MNKRSKNVKFLFTAYMIFSAYFLIMATSPSEPSLMILLGTVFRFFLPAALYNVVYRIFYFVADVVETSRRRLAAHVGRGGHDGFLETVTQLAAELFTGDADAYTAVFGQQVGGQVLGLVEMMVSGRVAYSIKSQATLGTSLT